MMAAGALAALLGAAGGGLIRLACAVPAGTCAQLPGGGAANPAATPACGCTCGACARLDELRRCWRSSVRRGTRGAVVQLGPVDGRLERNAGRLGLQERLRLDGLPIDAVVADEAEGRCAVVTAETGHQRVAYPFFRALPQLALRTHAAAAPQEHVHSELLLDLLTQRAHAAPSRSQHGPHGATHNSMMANGLQRKQCMAGASRPVEWSMRIRALQQA